MFLVALKEKRLNSWINLPLQIDAVDDDGHIIFSNDPQKLLLDPLTKNDRIILYTKDFGRAKKKEEVFPCEASYVFALKDSLKSTNKAYLIRCIKKPMNILDAPRLSQVTFDTKQKTVESENYRYLFSTVNHMLFRKIIFYVNSENAAIKEQDTAGNSDMLIRADVKKFFTLSFGKSDVESELENYMLGPIALSAKVSFFLKILFFRIRLKLSTDVSFFPDAANIPMMVTIPVDAYKYLNAKSGILYSWEMEPGIAPIIRPDFISILDESLVEKGSQELSKIGLSRCIRDFCFYRVEFNAWGRLMAMNFSLPKYLVEKGFFPLYVPNVEKSAERMGWTDFERESALLAKPPFKSQRIGLYFETSGLPEGNHPWDFWMTLGRKKTAWQYSCPHPVTFDSVKRE